MRLRTIALVIGVANTPMVMSGEFTKEQVKRVVTECTQELLNDLNVQFRNLIAEPFSCKPGNTSFVKSEKIFQIKEAALTVSVPEKERTYSYEILASLLGEISVSHDAKHFSSSNIMFSIPINQGHVHSTKDYQFRMVALPIVMFNVVENKFDGLGLEDSEQDLITVEKIARPEGPDKEFVVNKENGHDSKIFVDKKKYVDCLQKNLNQPEVEVLNISSFNKLKKKM